MGNQHHRRGDRRDPPRVPTPRPSPHHPPSQAASGRASHAEPTRYRKNENERNNAPSSHRSTLHNCALLPETLTINGELIAAEAAEKPIPRRPNTCHADATRAGKNDAPTQGAHERSDAPSSQDWTHNDRKERPSEASRQADDVRDYRAGCPGIVWKMAPDDRAHPTLPAPHTRKRTDCTVRPEIVSRPTVAHQSTEDSAALRP